MSDIARLVESIVVRYRVVSHRAFPWISVDSAVSVIASSWISCLVVHPHFHSDGGGCLLCRGRVLPVLIQNIRNP